MRLTTGLVCVTMIAAVAWAQQTAGSCENLATLSLPDTTITLATVVGPGDFTQPPNPAGRAGGRGAPPIFKTLPAFCRVALTLTPTNDSDIKSEVWLPLNSWNGKLQVPGNGGWAGNIGYTNLGAALAAGYAAAATDTGHVGSSASFAYGHPEKMLDFGYRSVHVTAVAAKAIVKAFYGDGPKESYFNGCSTGGRQALNAVQRYPADFNGVIAGAPVNPMTRLHAASLHNTLFAHQDEGNYIPPEKYPMIHKAVLEACDALDGLRDGLIQNPMACKFDPKLLQCKAEDGPACLTSKQVDLARKLYSGTINPRTKEQIYPGWERGSELGWGVTAGPQPEGPAIDTFRYVVFGNPDWDWRTLNLDSDIALADRMGNAKINAVSTNLKPFFDAGGKLLMFHGWQDPNVAPRNTVNYYNAVLKTAGNVNAIKNAVRLFMVPGMGHCGGGEGPNEFDRVGALDSWVTTGHAPEAIIASHSSGGKADRTRPLCPFPLEAKYKGSGSIDAAENFVCRK